MEILKIMRKATTVNSYTLMYIKINNRLKKKTEWRDNEPNKSCIKKP